MLQFQGCFTILLQYLLTDSRVFAGFNFEGTAAGCVVLLWRGLTGAELTEECSRSRAEVRDSPKPEIRLRQWQKTH